jgi:hypothetical protein
MVMVWSHARNWVYLKTGSQRKTGIPFPFQGRPPVDLRTSHLVLKGPTTCQYHHPGDQASKTWTCERVNNIQTMASCFCIFCCFPPVLSSGNCWELCGSREDGADQAPPFLGMAVPISEVCFLNSEWSWLFILLPKVGRAKVVMRVKGMFSWNFF